MGPVGKPFTLKAGKDGNIELKFENSGLLVQKLEMVIDAETQIPVVRLTVCPGQLDIAIAEFGLVAEEAKRKCPDGVERIFVLNDDMHRFVDANGNWSEPIPKVEFQVKPAGEGDLFQQQGKVVDAGNGT